MDIPVENPSTGCDACDGIAKYLDDWIRSLETKKQKEHLLRAMTKWLVRQTVASCDGDPSPLIQFITTALNAPETDARVHAFLERTQQEAPVPDAKVH